MEGNIVNLNINPCKMCMPMGAVSAFYGIRKCMTILHGSQGCSTYIRRHMATHYNEPIDIASSVLTEHGTVYGGEDNLIKGIKNLIKLYSPEVIGVATTCLAETIGEDISRIINNFLETNTDCNVTIIPVQTAGYGGTQFEGYWAALRAIIGNVKMDTTPNDKVNIITSLLSPADTRYLKQLLEMFEIDYILLPDISENLDGEHREQYQRLPSSGTPIAEISKMAGAKATIELSTFVEEKLSPAKYLSDIYNVPYIKLNLPIGIRDTNALIEQLCIISGKPIPESIKKEKGRYLDAMIDSHKYNGEGKAVVYGEPDFVYSMVRLCCENGIMPVVVATGSNCPHLGYKAIDEIVMVTQKADSDKYVILNDTDFLNIQNYALEHGANIMIGSSDARRIEEKYGIPLVRCTFPIHDRVGGQRIRTLGYEGSLQLLDSITNKLLEIKEGFRERIHKQFFAERNSTDMSHSIAAKTSKHPCYSKDAHNHARMHLPVAPKCNISCNYCVRKYDCPNESRPGVASEILSPEKALEKFIAVKQRMPNLSVVGIAGPGDALADWEKTKKTLSLIRKADPNITFCLSTNGLMLPFYANEIVKLGVSHVTVTINAIDTAIGAKIYKHIDYLGTTYTGETAATILLANQLAGLKLLSSKGVVCKVNTVLLTGINDTHVEEVVKKVKELGCFVSNIMPLIPVKGSVFENLPLVSNKELHKLRKKCGEHLNQMYHCRQCRADAVGTLDMDSSIEFRGCGNNTGCGSSSNNINSSTSSSTNSSCVGSDSSTNSSCGSSGTCSPSGTCDSISTCTSSTICNANTNSSNPCNTNSDASCNTNGGASCNTNGGASCNTDAASKHLRFAVFSKSGLLVDQHFGHATELYIYELKDGEAAYVEKRQVKKYCTGSECDDDEGKIDSLIRAVADCNGILTLRIGDAPSKRLAEVGIEVITTYDTISEAVKKAAFSMSDNSKKCVLQ